MWSILTKIEFDARRVRQAMHRATIRSLGHAAALVRKIAQHSIRYRKDRRQASPEGQPPYTHTKRLPRAILYSVEQQEQRAVIGPDATKIGTVGAAHEHGGPFRGEHFDRRPFMGPALEKATPRLPEFWAHSVR